MDGHDPDLFAAAVTFAFNFRVAAVKPSDEFLQAAAMLLFKLQGSVQHFLDWDQHLATQTRREFAPRADWTG